MIWLALTGLALGGALAARPPAARASGGKFPNEPFNGMTIAYGIQGAQLGTPLDQSGFTTRRSCRGQLLGPVRLTGLRPGPIVVAS